MIEFICHKEDGQIQNEASVKKQFDQLKDGQYKDGRYKVTIQKSNNRTLQQNNWLHAVLPDILKGLRDAGFNELRTTEDAKQVVKTMFFKKMVTNGIEEIEVIEDTSKTSKEVFMERADQIITWAKDYLGIDVAPPLKKFEMFSNE